MQLQFTFLVPYIASWDRITDPPSGSEEKVHVPKT